ncbi:putative Calcium-binding EF-hand family protein [Hibiscus syriacus]|uniref:Putative Calcium-binding EF-hand family protein n=1 Tax=Hibiscus syriacus TaxID=106335 RepID=A0A6A2YXI6_HIBSY|nr:putative Calcium-binding EF-hand family protein [Hibiscus syriacus]KAE8684118.1 putative Calcium-binding EF-hand family protein [Hibiscus syriacus]KAE8684120.1 putative Calcium-binding EF-hand family protein [Hibiscus syriacus]
MSTLNVDKRCRRKRGKKKEDWSPNDPPLDQQKTMLERYDHNHDGCLSKEVLKQASSSLGLRFPAWKALGAGLHHTDANNEGLISKEELDTMVKYATEHSYNIKVYLA